MNIYAIKSCAIEVTRKCNQNCKHCMRGEQQEIDIPKEYVDTFLNKIDKKIVSTFVFSGGEPTLNEDMVVYIIDEIIRRKMIIGSVQMTTNGTIYSEKIQKAFERFIEYSNKVLEPFISKVVPIHEKANIIISQDIYHEKIKNEILELYQNNKVNTTISFTNTQENNILLTGRSKTKTFNFYKYKLNDINTKKYNNNYFLLNNNIYLNAKGKITTNGDGSYEDMDKIYCASIEDFDFESLENIKTKKRKLN